MPRKQVTIRILGHRSNFRGELGVDMTQWYYNIRTHEVEEGKQSLASELDGPFDSREDAAHAPEIIAERARKWAEDDAKND